MVNYQYVDRKMMKWMPFNALLEHSEYISDLLNNREKINKPVLSVDQYYDLNLKLEEAYHYNNPITIKYYNNGYIKEVIGKISRIDIYNKIIFIEDTGVKVNNVVDIYLN